MSQNAVSCGNGLKDFADDKFEFGEKGRKFPKRVENIVGKGEFAHYDQFLFFTQCFQKTCTADTCTSLERVKLSLSVLVHSEDQDPRLYSQ